MISQIKRGALDVILVENEAARAEISLFGSHLLSFIPKHDQRERLWLSSSAILDKTTPIRGGIPICWPWFSEAPTDLKKQESNLPSHGFVRTQDCLLVSSNSLNSDLDQIVLKPSTYPFETLKLSLELEVIITVGHELKVQLVTRNTTANTVSFFAALHSYFQITNIENLLLQGIDSDYLDKTQSMSRMPALQTYTINSETDRVHLGTSPNISIVDSTYTTQVKSEGNDSIVVWNPWKTLSKSMVDIDELGYRNMVCIETARTQEGLLRGNETHTLTQIIS